MDDFLTKVKAAKEALANQGIKPPDTPDFRAAIKDMELQWQDHFHMRDQTWKTLHNSALIFAAVVGVEISKGASATVMSGAYFALVLLSSLGFLIAVHHRHIQQKVKFPIIVRYEVLLGLTPAFEDILQKHSIKGLSTSTFIIASHAVVGSISAMLFATKICEALALGCPRGIAFVF